MNPALVQQHPQMQRQPQQQDPHQIIATLNTVIAFLLYERREESDLRKDLERTARLLHRERHGAEILFEKCEDSECRRLGNIVRVGRGAEITMNPLSIQLMSRYRVIFQTLGNSLRVLLTDKSALEPAGQKL